MNIYNRKNEVKREIYSEMLKKGKQKSSTRLSDKVIVRQWMENECHHHVKDLGPFAKLKQEVF